MAGGGRWEGLLLVGQGEGWSSQTEQNPAKPPGKEKEVGEGGLEAGTGMGDGSAMTSQGLLPVVPSCRCTCLVQTRGPWGAGAKPPPGLLQSHFQMRGSIPAEWGSQFPALTPLQEPAQRARRHQRLRILLPAANKTYLSLPSHSPCPPLRGDRAEGPPWPSPSIAGSLPAPIE